MDHGTSGIQDCKVRPDRQAELMVCETALSIPFSLLLRIDPIVIPLRFRHLSG